MYNAAINQSATLFILPIAPFYCFMIFYEALPLIVPAVSAALSRPAVNVGGLLIRSKELELKCSKLNKA